MRCSLLALSSYIDTELDQEPAGELEAHLVACDRCRTAIGHLREESGRIAGLARVHVPDDAVHDLFIQIGLIAEDDELPDGPVHRDRPAPVEAPPWFGAERGAALPWAPRPTGHFPSQPRELVGERSPIAVVAEPPELLLWDETIDQIPTAAPVPPPVHVVPAPQPVPLPEIEPEVVAVDPYPITVVGFEPATDPHLEPQPVDHFHRDPVASFEAESFPEPTFSEPQPPEVMAPEPQPPDLSTSAPMVTPPRLATGPNAFQRVRDAVAVRFALRRRGGGDFDSGVEIVSGVGAPRWDQRARSRHWSDSPPITAAAVPPAPAATVIEPPEPAVHRPNPFSRLVARITAAPAAADLDDAVPHEADAELAVAADRDVTAPDAAKATHDEVKASPAPQLADVLSEVASLAAPLERPHTPVTNGTYADPSSWMDDTPPEPTIEYRGAGGAAAPAAEPDTATVEEDETQFGETPFGLRDEAASPPAPGRHVRRLQSGRSGRRGWNPTQPVTGRHVLPLGGPAVAAADRDRRLWLFGAITVVLMLLGLLIGRQVTQTGSPLAATLPRATPTHHATTTTPPTAAPVSVATPALSPIAILPTAPTPQQLTGTKTLGNGASGFSVADVRYGEHPNDFRLVFDMAFPNTVTGDPATVIGYDGATTLYVEFTGVSGASNIATMPLHQVVVSVVALPAVRNSDRLVFKITLTKKAAFDPYYLSGARLVIDIT
jgi:hypothetical protein